MNEDKDAPAYHIFRRLSDVVITVAAVGAILLGLFKWLYLRPVMTEGKVEELQAQILVMSDKLDSISSQIEATDRRLTNFQASFKLGKPGRWAIQGDGWKWIENKEKGK